MSGKTRGFSKFTVRACIIAVFLCLLTLGMLSCHLPRSVSTSSFQEPEEAIKKMAVLPFQSVPPESFARISEVVAKPASIIQSFSAPSSPSAVVEEIFWSHLLNTIKVPLVSPAKTGLTYGQIVSSSTKLTFPDALRKLGDQLEVDAVFVGFVYRYRERVGFSYGADKPASVFFEIHLYRCRDGSLLWRAVFDKTQKSLMEDMLDIKSFIKDRGKWVTAKELANEGVKEIISRFPLELIGQSGEK